MMTHNAEMDGIHCCFGIIYGESRCPNRGTYQSLNVPKLVWCDEHSGPKDKQSRKIERRKEKIAQKLVNEDQELPVPPLGREIQSTGLEANGHSHRMVSLEGRLELEKLRDTCDAGHEFIVGLAHRQNGGAANIANVKHELFMLNGKDVRVTIEWRDAAIAAQSTEEQEDSGPTPPRLGETSGSASSIVDWKWAMVKCVLPYEALLADPESRKWIAPEIWRSIESAVATVRQVVTDAPPVETEPGQREAEVWEKAIKISSSFSRSGLEEELGRPVDVDTAMIAQSVLRVVTAALQAAAKKGVKG